MEFPGQSRDVAKVPSAPPQAEPGYGFDSQYLSNSQFQDQAVPSYEQNQNAQAAVTNYAYDQQQQYGGGYYDQYQAPQFYDPSLYSQSPIYPQPNQYFDQSPASQQVEPQESHAQVQPQMYDPSQYQTGALQSEISSRPSSQPAQEVTHSESFSAQAMQMPPPVTFFNPGQYQSESQKFLPPAMPPKVETPIMPPPLPEAQDQQSSQGFQENFQPHPVTFFNPGQYPVESQQFPPPAVPQHTESPELPPPVTKNQQSGQSNIQDNFVPHPVTFFNPGQYPVEGQQFPPPAAPQNTETQKLHNPPPKAEDKQSNKSNIQDNFVAPPVTFFNPGQYPVESQQFFTPAMPPKVDTPNMPPPPSKAQDQQSSQSEFQENFQPHPVAFFNPGQYLVQSQQLLPPAEPQKIESPKLPTPPPEAQDQHGIQDNFVPQPVSFFNPNQYPVENQQQFVHHGDDARFPTPPAVAQDQQSNQSEDLQLNSSLSQISLQEMRGSPIQSETSIPETEPINIYNMNQNTSIYQHLPSEFLNTSANLPAEPPVSSTPLSSYFTQKCDSRPSSVASNRSQLTSFFERQDTPPTFHHQGGLKSAADFFDSPQSFGTQPPQPFSQPAAQEVNFFNAPPQNQNSPQVFSAFSQSQQKEPPSTVNFFNPAQQMQVESHPPVAPAAQFFTPPAPAATPPAPVQVAPPLASPPKHENVPPAAQFFSPEAHPQQSAIQDNKPPASQFFVPGQAQVPQPAAPMANFFTPASSGSASDFFGAPPQAAAFFEPQQVQPAAPAPPLPAVADVAPPKQKLPPAAFHSPVRTAASPPITTTELAPSVQLFNPTLFGQAPKAEGPPQGDANKFRLKSALNKYAVPPSLANTAPSYFAPAAVFPLAPTPAQPTNFFNPQPPVVNPHIIPAAVPPASVSSFFNPEPAKCKTPPNTPAVHSGTANPMAQFFNAAQGTSMQGISEESMNQALTSTPVSFAPYEPQSIPVAQFPTYPEVIDPNSNSAALKQHFSQHEPKQVSFFTPAQTQDAPVNPAEVNSENPLPPPTSAMCSWFVLTYLEN